MPESAQSCFELSSRVFELSQGLSSEDERPWERGCSNIGRSDGQISVAIRGVNAPINNVVRFVFLK